ncbi:MAG: DUF58 domain-containing protein [Flavipsychrobacter sp.]|nr:DUF58 domain-containing protein [Flavipsychrobacter sp.]
MISKQLRWKIKYWLQYFPFTLNTLLCTLAVYFAYKLLYRPPNPKKIEYNAFQPFIILMAKMALWFVAGVILLSLLSTLASWIYYLYLSQKEKHRLQVDFTLDSVKGKKNKLFLSAQIEGAYRPLLGFVKGRLFYDNYEMTDRFTLLSNRWKEKSWGLAAITGKSRLLLPDIKEYQLNGGFVYFQDMLHIFSLAVAQPVKGHFYQPPVLAEDDDREVYPKKTEQMDVRIEQMRRVEGELLNYKDFEAGDDVRRIVWKVYAKNRELVVRTPEMFEPYASHLYFYASFHAAVKGSWLGEGYMKEMLNYYKNYVWTAYDTLSRKEWEMRYIPDQNLTVPEQLGEAEKSARIISNSNWHTDQSVAMYFKPRQGAVLCISSLVEPEELKNILSQCDSSTVVYFVRVSRVFRSFVAWHWLKRAIFLPPKDRLAKLRSTWIFSPMRVQILKREKEIETILDSSGVIVGVL